MRYALLSICCLALGLVAGAELTAWRTGDLVPEVNITTKECAAIDTGKRRIIGYWMMTERGCHLRDWRLWHPFG